jgi:serine/threonine-protein kinase RIO1
MTQKRANPAPLAADRARNTITATAIGSENKSPAPNLQDHRAHWLSRRYQLTTMMAATLSDIAFGEATR